MYEKARFGGKRLVMGVESDASGGRTQCSGCLEKQRVRERERKREREREREREMR